MTVILEQTVDTIPTTSVDVICPDCGSRDVSHCGVCRDPGLLKLLPATEKHVTAASATAGLYACRNCELGFRSPPPDSASLQALYAAMPTERWHYATHPESWKLAERWLQKQFPLTDDVRILDIGAFNGAFLQTLPQSWKRYAIEPSVAAHAELKQLGVTVIAEFLETPAREFAGQFDVVTIFDVFEHLPQPRQAIAHALEYVRPGGHLLLSTGNCHHWTWGLLGGDHWYCEPVQHLCFGNRRYLAATAAACGGRLLIAQPHAHQLATWCDRVSQAYESYAYVALRKRVWWTPLVKLVSLLPGWNFVRHKTTAPYTPALRDHLFCVIEKCR